MLECVPPIDVAQEAGVDVNNVPRKLSFRCEALNIPSINMNVHEGRRYTYGALEKRPTAPMFNDLTLTFMYDGVAETYDVFHKWLSKIVNFDMSESIAEQGENTIFGNAPYELSYRAEYVTDITLLQFDQTGEVVQATTLRDAHPINLGDLPLNWSDNNSYLRIPVQISFVDLFTDRQYIS